MNTFFFIIKIIHISCGAIALLAGIGAIGFRKKVNIHKRFGKIYFWAMTVIFLSAIYLTLVKWNVFLLCVAFFSYYQCLVAFRSLRLKKIHLGQRPKKFDWAIEIFFGTAHIGFIVFALIQFFNGALEIGIVSLVFGATGMRGNWNTLKRLQGKLTDKNYWLVAHISGMLGSYIGAITAFTVNNNQWIGLPDLLAWLGPTAVLVPFIIYEIRKLKPSTLV